MTIGRGSWTSTSWTSSLSANLKELSAPSRRTNTTTKLSILSYQDNDIQDGGKNSAVNWSPTGQNTRSGSTTRSASPVPDALLSDTAKCPTLTRLWAESTLTQQPMRDFAKRTKGTLQRRKRNWRSRQNKTQLGTLSRNRTS